MSAIVLWPLWGLGTLILSLTSMFYYWHSAISFPASIPLVGVRNEVLSKPRAWIRELKAGLATLHNGYFTVGKKKKNSHPSIPLLARIFISIFFGFSFTQRLMAVFMWCGASTTQKGSLSLS